MLTEYLADYLNKLNRTYHFQNSKRIEKKAQKVFATKKAIFND